MVVLLSNRAPEGGEGTSSPVREGAEPEVAVFVLPAFAEGPVVVAAGAELFEQAGTIASPKPIAATPTSPRAFAFSVLS